MLVLSTTTATPWFSKRWSSSLAASNASAYWKPEQPPPRTATRRACSEPLSCSPSSSLILPAALSVSLIGCGDSLIGTHCRDPRCGVRTFACVFPVEILEDAAGVADHLLAVDQHRHIGKLGELDDFRAARAPAPHSLRP